MSEAMLRIREIIAGGKGNQAVKVPQALIDEAYESDAEAERWLGAFGYGVIMGRLHGKPGLATVFRLSSRVQSQVMHGRRQSIA